MGIFDSIVNSAKSSIKNSIKSGVNSAVNGTVRDVTNSVTKKASNSVQKAFTHKTKTFKYEAIPATVDELKALKEADMKDPFGVAALSILALNVIATDRENGLKMIDFLNGPSDVSEKDNQFINDRFMDGKEFVVKSYFKGATPNNNYTPGKPYTIDVIEEAHSRDTINEGFIKLFVHSGGADSDRYMVLRTKPSTGEWFLWDYTSLLASIRTPVEKNPWA